MSLDDERDSQVDEATDFANFLLRLLVLVLVHADVEDGPLGQESEAVNASQDENLTDDLGDETAKNDTVFEREKKRSN